MYYTLLCNIFSSYGLLLFPTTFSITLMAFGPVSFSAYDSYDMVNKPERIFRYFF